MKCSQKLISFIKNKIKGHKVSLISGNFNVFHTGHHRLFKFAKSLSDILVVAINKDNSGITFFPQQERYENIKDVGLVDYCLPIENNINYIISYLKPNYIIKGIEYKNLFNQEELVAKKNSGKLVFFSTSYTNESDKYFNYKLEKNKTFNLPKQFIKNHSINTAKIVSKISDFSKLRVLVIGDIIIDQYVSCSPIGMSREDPSVVFKQNETNIYLGGSAIVALHARRLGAKVTFLSVSGSDQHHEFISEQLKKEKIKCKIFVDKDRCTTVKKRFMSKNKILFKLSEIKDNLIEKKIEDEIIKVIRNNEYDLISICDFNYGLITNKIIDEVSKKKSLKTADCQTSSQIGDIKKFKKFDLITPTEYEVRTSLHDNQSGLANLVNKLYLITKNKNIIITLGDQGALINTRSKNTNFTDQIRALNSSPNNISGAGDCFFIACSLCLSINLNIWESSLIASIAAACHISEDGNTPISISEIINHLK